MKKNILTKISILAGSLALVTLIGVSADWSAPTAPAVTDNLAVPIHEGLDQVKDQGLSVNGFIAYKNAAFLQDIYLYGPVIGRTDGEVRFGGTSTDGLSTLHEVTLNVNGKTSAVGAITEGSVANTSDSHLCADTTGKIVTCDSGAGAGDDECPEGQIHIDTRNGACGYTVEVDSSKYTGAEIKSVTGIPGFVFSGPLTANGSKQQQYGLHDTFNGSMDITVVGPNFYGLPAQLNVYKNDNATLYKIGCYPLSPGVTTSVSTPVYSYLESEPLRISINTGGC